MFDIGSTELLLTAIVAIVVIGPKDLPRALYKVGQIVGKARGVARHFRTGLDTMIREAELEELEKKWAAENERIMQKWPSEDVAIEQAKALGAPSDGGDDVPGHDPTDEYPLPQTSDEPAPAMKDGPAA